MKNIRRRPFDIKTLRLSPEEGFVLSRLDAPLSAKELVALTGLDEGRIAQIVEGLAGQGVVDLDRDGAPPPAAAAPTGQSSAAPHKPTRPDPEESDSQLEDDAGAEARADEAAAAAAADGDGIDLGETPEEAATRETGEREYRKIYEETFHKMSKDERLAAAEHADGANLFALCLDADPQIINAVMSNPKAGLEHARMIVLYHRTPMGLEIVGKRNEMLADAQVQRRLLANPQLPVTLLRRIISPKLIMDVYKIAINREIPERSRVMTRELLQKKFMQGSPDERAALLIKTEGRCLILLVNCAIDARTTQMLTSKTSYTVLFIQNLARWSATPPALLTHLLKQPVVRMNVGLKKMLLKHPNVPSEVKRGF